jgi:hypothetical protein
MISKPLKMMCHKQIGQNIQKLGFGLFNLVAILNLCKLEYLGVKNQEIKTRNELYTFQNPEHDVLHMIIGQMVQKLCSDVAIWRPFLIDANLSKTV